MSLAPGTRLGAYEIVALIGAGGMGEVYRARDARLGRDVAIKVLPAAFSADADRLRRFEQEARAAAALNHPNILSVHDIGSQEGAPYVVSELLEGETLRARIGALPVRKACEYAIQIARGLAAAHEKGIVHRDLKPENLFVTDDGRVKILDFGLAKLTQKDSPLVSGTNVPTTPLADKTEAGMVLGTIGYMAPEQVRAQAVDHRADLFAFGAILYEMLSGQRAFHGETTIDTMTSILKDDPPDLPAAERHIPPALSRIVDRCIEKSPGARFQSANDLAFALEGLSSQSETGVGAPQIAPSRGLLRDARVAWAVAALLAIGLVASAFVFAPQTQPAPQTIAFEIDAPTALAAQQFALSPLGTHMVAAVGTGPTSSLWLHPMSRVGGQTLPGTEYALSPFWSPDDRFVAFFSNGKLKKVDIFGAPPQTIADAPLGRGGSWNGDNIIIFSPQETGPIFRVGAGGGDVVQLTELDSARKETGHWHPYFLPDGRHFLFLARSSMPEHDAIYFASLDSKERTRLVGSTVKAAFAPPDRLLFTRGTALMAQRFDAERGVLAGDPVQIVEQVGMNATSGAAGFSVSANGLLAHRLGRVSRSPDTVLTWFDRTGKPIGTLGDPAGHRNPRISPDGTRVVVERSDDAISSVDLWLLDMARKVPTKLTFAAANFGNVAPLWSPDGTRVAWQSRIAAGAPPTIFHKRIGGTAKDEKIRLLPGASSIDDWAGEMGILFHDGGIPPRAPGLQILPLDGGEPRMLGAARTILTHARMSPEPDRRWIAYTSSDTGRPEIYVQNFPTPTESIPVSANGGIQPLWRRDGRELFFLAPDGTLMAAPIQVSPRLAAGEPVALFPTRVEGGGTMSPGIWHQYDITRDGRFLINTLVQDQSTPSTFPITVVVNWAAGLK